MKNKRVIYMLGKKINSESGAVIVLVAICLIVLIGYCGIGCRCRLLAGKQERASECGGCISAGRDSTAWSHIRGHDSYCSTELCLCLQLSNPNDIIEVGKAAALSNSAAGQPVAVLNADVEVGTWDQTRNPRFVATTVSPMPFVSRLEETRAWPLVR